MTPKRTIRDAAREGATPRPPFVGPPAPAAPQASPAPPEAAPPTPPNPEKAGGWKLKGRLPHHSMITAIYDAGRKEWVGTLKVGGMNPFSATAGAIFKLLMKLDDLYRKATGEKK